MKTSVFYQLPATGPQSARQRYHDTFDQIRHADELGFHTAWLAEGHFDRSFSVMPSPLTVAAALATMTRRIRLGTAAVQLPMHHPVAIAEIAAVVDVLSDGRLELGFGRGSSPFQLAGFGVPWHERDSRFAEGLAVVQQALSRPRVDHRGEYFTLSGVPVEPRPLQPGGPPIHITANSPRSAQFAGENGHGLLMAAPIRPWPDAFAHHVAIYREAARRAGVTPRVGAVFFVFPGRDMNEVRATVARSLGNHPIGAAVPFDMAAQSMAIFGSPEQCGEKLQAIADSGLVDELIGWFNPGGLIEHDAVLEAMTVFRREVVATALGSPDAVEARSACA